MEYFKIKLKNKIIGVVTNNDFRRFQQKHGLLLLSDKASAQYACVKNVGYFHDLWMNPVTTDKVSYQIASIEEISKDEYEKLYETLEEGVVYLPEETEENTPSIFIDESLGEIRDSKISEIGLFCRKNIQDGFDATLSNNQTYHFSLGIVDQLNITRLYHRALTEETFLPYHADGLLCEIFSKEDIYTIYEKMEEVINYHTIYHNSLKNYVLSLKNTQDIKAVKYGMDIPVEYQSEVFKNLLGK